MILIQVKQGFNISCAGENLKVSVRSKWMRLFLFILLFYSAVVYTQVPITGDGNYQLQTDAM